MRSAEAQAWQQAEVALEAAKVRRVVTKEKGWMRDDLVKRLKHIETPSKQGATVFFFLETRSSFTLGRFCIERFEIAGLRMFGRQ